MEKLFAIGLINAVVATVLAIAVWCVTRVWRHPPFVALLWTLVLVKLVTPPLISIPWRFDRSVANTVVPRDLSKEFSGNALTTRSSIQSPDTLGLPERAAATTNPNSPLLGTIHEAVAPHTNALELAPHTNSASDETLDWLSLLAVVWMSGGTIWLLIAAGRLTRFHRALRHTDTCPDELLRRANEVAASLGVTSRYRLRMTDARLSPFVWPIGRPTIVLSRPLLDTMSHKETDMLLAHELAHVRRKDHWLRWLEFVVTAIYWWHPVVWWARHMIQRAEEQACDAWVVWAFPESAKRYASALFKAVQMATEHRARAPLVASRLGSTGNLKERIEDIMNVTWSCRISNPARLALILLVISILPFSLRFASASGEQSIEPKVKTTAANDEKANTSSSSNDPALPAANKPIPSAAKATKSEPSSNPSNVRVPANPYRVAAGDVLHVAVSNAFSDQPIADDYLVEPGGTIALGPAYGRANVAGMTLEEADRAVRKHLAEIIKDPVVQVTLGGWRGKYGSWAGRPGIASGNAQSARNNDDPSAQTSASGARSNLPIRPEEFAALREHVRFLDERFKSIDSLYKTGSRGGSADARARTGFELATAQAELAAAEGHRDQAIAYGEQAEKFAAEAMNAVNASYDAGRLALDTLLQTAKDVSDSKRRLVRLREPQATVTVEAKRDVASRVASSDSNMSVTVSKTLMQRTLQKYERIKRLAELKVVPAEEVEAAKTDYEVSIAQVEHAQRVLKYAQLLVELADTEYQEALAKNKSAPNSVSEFEVKKLKLKVELAKVKASEVE